MKKLSLVLALILVLTCAVLAACGGDETSTPATSKPAPSSKVESSVASSSAADSSVVESSEADSSVVESSEAADSSDVVESSEAADSSDAVESSSVESSEVVESSAVESSEVVESSDVESSVPEVSEPETSTPAGEGKNIAVGKTYDAKGYKAGGEWPADYTANLTDGVAHNELSFDNQWFAFCISEGDNGLNAPDGVGSVIIDLGASSNITKVRMNTIFGENVDQSGINGPSKITAYVSDSADGEFVALGDLTSSAKEGAAWAELNCAGKGQFVKLEVTLSGTFAFINEIEVYN